MKNRKFCDSTNRDLVYLKKNYVFKNKKKFYVPKF